MGDFVGVRALSSLFDSPSLKRDAVIFKRIAIPQLESYQDAELDWLRESDVVFDPHEAVDHPRIRLSQEYEEFIASVHAQNLLPPSNDIAEAVAGAFELYHAALSDMGAPSLSKEQQRIRQLHMRYVSAYLREMDNLDAYPILTSRMCSIKTPQASRSDVIQIILNALPEPDESISWEQIIEYRSDPDSQSKFLALRNWMNETARASLSPTEIEQKLEYLIDEYQQHMKIHKMKTNVGTLESVVVAGAEVLENLIKFNWGKVAKGLFSIKQRRIELMEAERTAPGREVAYIAKARDVL